MHSIGTCSMRCPYIRIHIYTYTYRHLSTCYPCTNEQHHAYYYYWQYTLLCVLPVYTVLHYCIAQHIIHGYPVWLSTLRVYHAAPHVSTTYSYSNPRHICNRALVRVRYVRTHSTTPLRYVRTIVLLTVHMGGTTMYVTIHMQYPLPYDHPYERITIGSNYSTYIHTHCYHCIVAGAVVLRSSTATQYHIAMPP